MVFFCRILTSKIHFEVHNKFYILLCLVFFMSFSHYGKACSKRTVISVSTQVEFERLNTNVHKNLKEGFEDIQVKFSPGVFYYNEEHIRLTAFENTSLSISFVGNNTTLIANGKYFYPSHKSSLGLSYTGSDDCFGKTYLSNKNELIDIDGEVMMSSSLVEVVDKEKKLCRILTHYNGPLTTGMRILITEWYKSSVYPVKAIKDNYVYFTADDLKMSPSYHCYNVNLDYGFSKGKCYPRYRIFNESSKSKAYIDNKIFYPINNVSYVHECNASRFLYASNLNLKSLKIQGIEFVGNKESSSLCQFNKVNAEEIIITKCIFRFLRNYIVLVNSSNNFTFDDNIVEYCFYNGILSDNGSKNTIIQRNVFLNNGAKLNQHSCVDCRGENYYIHHNEFRNFSYSAINVGLYYQTVMVNPTCGIVEYNTIWFDNDYFDNYYKYTLMDSGAIYVTTQNENAVIRFNVIHDYIGMYANRGIFCDTGSKNVEIYGNAIWNIPNSNAIELWNVKEPEVLVPDANTGNKVYDNIIGGKYQFESKKGGNNIHEKNVVLYPTDDVVPQVILKQLDSSEEDVFIEGMETQGGVLYMPKSSKKVLRKSLAYSNPILKVHFRQ